MRPPLKNKQVSKADFIHTIRYPQKNCNALQKHSRLPSPHCRPSSSHPPSLCKLPPSLAKIPIVNKEALGIIWHQLFRTVYGASDRSNRLVSRERSLREITYPLGATQVMRQPSSCQAALAPWECHLLDVADDELEVAIGPPLDAPAIAVALARAGNVTQTG